MQAYSLVWMGAFIVTHSGLHVLIAAKLDCTSMCYNFNRPFESIHILAGYNSILLATNNEDDHNTLKFVGTFIFAILV